MPTLKCTTYTAKRIKAKRAKLMKVARELDDLERRADSERFDMWARPPSKRADALHRFGLEEVK